MNNRTNSDISFLRSNVYKAEFVFSSGIVGSNGKENTVCLKTEFRGDELFTKEGHATIKKAIMKAKERLYVPDKFHCHIEGLDTNKPNSKDNEKSI